MVFFEQSLEKAQSKIEQGDVNGFMHILLQHYNGPQSNMARDLHTIQMQFNTYADALSRIQTHLRTETVQKSKQMISKELSTAIRAAKEIDEFVQHLSKDAETLQ